jgi:hypothetical protein
VLNATFSNISAISWRPVLVVEEAGVPGKNHRPWASNPYKTRIKDILGHLVCSIVINTVIVTTGTFEP